MLEQIDMHRVLGDPLLRRFWKALNVHDKNLFVLIIGDTGAGKSGCAITIADLCDRGVLGKRRFFVECSDNGTPSFDTRIVYGIEDFLRFATAKNHCAPYHLPVGSFVIWDETGVEGDNTQWFNLKSRIAKYVMQTGRYLNRGIIMTVPDAPSITIGSRRLIEWYIDVVKRIDEKGFCITKPYKMYKNRITGKCFPYSPKFKRNGILYSNDSINILRPVPELELPYKKIKEKATQDWYRTFDVEIAKAREFAKEKGILKGDVDETLAGLDKEGREANLLDIKEYILSNRDLFVDRKRLKVNVDAVLLHYLENKHAVLPKEKLKSVVAAINFDLQKNL